MTWKPTNLLFLLLILAVLFSVSGCVKYYVTIKSDPVGASVNDLTQGYLCETPCKYPVKRGDSLNLTFEKDKFEPVKRDILNVKNHQSMMVTLHSFPTLLFIESIPPGATLKVYDTMSSTPVSLENPTKILTNVFFTNRIQKVPNDLRDATIVLDKKGYKTLSSRVKLEPYIQNSFSFQMEPIFLTLEITSEPSGAEVYERKKGFLGRTPLKLDMDWEMISSFSQLQDAFNLESVDLNLTISKEGYTSKSVNKTLFIYQNNPPLSVKLK